MSDKVELIAAAQVNASASGISFNSNFGFKTASNTAPGVYDLSLDDNHDSTKLVIKVTQDGSAPGDISASPIGTGDIRNILVTAFDGSNAPVDVPFFIQVLRVRS